MTAAQAHDLTVDVIFDGPAERAIYKEIETAILAACNKGRYKCEYPAHPNTVDGVCRLLKAQGYNVDIGPGKGDPLAHPFGVYEISWESR